MKKLVLGCLGIVVVLAVAGGVLGYVYIVRPAREYLVAFQEMAAIGDLDKQISNQEAFDPPLSGELTPEMVDRFTRVQETVRDALGARFADLQSRYADLEAAAKAEAGRVSLGRVLEAYRDLVTALGDAKRAQVNALNDAGFSLAEYEWVQRQMYEAAGILVASVDLDALQQAISDRADRLEVKPSPGAGDVPDRNKALVQPYLEKLKEWLPLAWFGL